MEGKKLLASKGWLYKFLQKKGYGKSFFILYRGQIDFFIRYANASGYTEYTPEIGQTFLSLKPDCGNEPKSIQFKLSGKT